MKAACFTIALAISCFSGCSTPGSRYAKGHPELSAVHRQILTTGNVPGGFAVGGMTKEQVRLAAGNPARVERFDGQEAWVYVHERFLDIDPHDDPGAKFGSASNNQRNFTETANLGPRPSANEVTTVFFKGDRATHTQLSQQRR